MEDTGLLIVDTRQIRSQVINIQVFELLVVNLVSYTESKIESHSRSELDDNLKHNNKVSMWDSNLTRIPN